MSGYWAPALYAIGVWWFATGLILFLDGLPKRTFRWSMVAATAMLGPAFYGLMASSTDTTPGGAYVAFSCAVLIWGWQEMSFLMGYLTGPRRRACAAGCRGWHHFVHAVEAILYHELSIVAFAILIVTATWNTPNQFGAWTFLTLWGMRQSAKLNLFFGVPNLGEEFLPAHLQYLRSFFSRKPMNLLFPFSVTISTSIAAVLIHQATGDKATAFEVTAYTLLSSLMVLAILEHWFMVLPIPVAALWNWSLRSRDASSRDGHEPPVHRVALFVDGQWVEPARVTGHHHND